MSVATACTNALQSIHAKSSTSAGLGRLARRVRDEHGAELVLDDAAKRRRAVAVARQHELDAARAHAEYPLLALAPGVAAAVHGFERERVRDLFSRFVPEAVVDDVLARVDDDCASAASGAS